MSQNPINLALRFLLEIIALVAIGAWALFSLNPIFGWMFGLVTLVHYILSYDRIAWLLKR